jgi:hypothetical protein
MDIVSFAKFGGVYTENGDYLSAATLAEYEAMGINREDAVKFWHAGFSAGAIRPFINSASSLFLEQSTTSTLKRPKRKLTVNKLLNG